MAIHPLETYLKEMRRVHASNEAQAETSFYTPIANLLNAVGREMEPRVSCVLQLKDRGADHPDGGLFTEEQLVVGASFTELVSERSPARGVFEVKSLDKEVGRIGRTSQVKKYWAKYGLVLVSNYRDFLLIGRDTDGQMVPLESFTLAATEEAFWTLTESSRTAAGNFGAAFVAYLERALQHEAPITEPGDVAALLAAYARQARDRLAVADLPALATIRAALEQSLSVTFEGEKGEHFFRSTLVQTLFYGVFSAFVLWGRKQVAEGRAGRFDWENSARYLRVPVIRKLFHEVADPGPLDAVGVTETLDWAETALNRVVLNAFFARFGEEDAIQYFYEPFLEAFDPELRKELGVWYTPQEIVKYQVARVDQALREELGIEDGLADPSVYVLDPCCGTGAYLVETLRVIANTLGANGGEALIGADLKQAITTRIFGFEILPAPYVVAHLQLGLTLQEAGVALSDAHRERVGVYLTNALTGWEPPIEPKQALLFPEFEQERDAAERVKRDDPVLVILGNPPYNGFAGVSPAEEEGLVEPYKEGIVTRNSIDDLYVRFYRVAERRIAEKAGRGIVSFISNYSWLTEASFVTMRERFLREFDSIWIDNLNGDSRETGKLTPDGQPDPSAFSTPRNREGIRVGTAIALLVCNGDRPESTTVRYRQFWGASKRLDLLATVSGGPRVPYTEIVPRPSNRYLLRPWIVGATYNEWPSLVDLAAVPPMLGMNENRGQTLFDVDRNALGQRMRDYLDSTLSFDTIRTRYPRLAANAARFDAEAVRSTLIALEGFKEDQIRRFWFKPFDLRWAYVESRAKLWNEVRRELQKQTQDGNEFLIIRNNAPKSPDGAAFFWSHDVIDQHMLHKDAYLIPMRVHTVPDQGSNGTDVLQQSLLQPDRPSAQPASSANLSEGARSYLDALSLPDPDEDAATASLVWLHALALGYSPSYLRENASGVRHGWARIPLPDTPEALQASAALGREVTLCLDTTREVRGITQAPWRPFLQSVGATTRAGGGALAEEECALTGWGYTSKGGIVMPGAGHAEMRPYNDRERTGLEAEAQAAEVAAEALLELLGEQTYDVYLNDIAYWRNVPARVWNYSMGGFPVIKKWLSYRDAGLLGRALTTGEVREVERMIRRVTALVLLEPRLNDNYAVAKAGVYHWNAAGLGGETRQDISAF